MMVIRNPGNKKFQPYQEEDQVWIECTNLKTLYPLAKLAPKCYGLFKVMKKLSPAVYKIRIPHQWKIHNVFHANLITPYKEMAIHRPNYSQPPPDLVDGEEELEVEQIINMKQMGWGQKTYYLVKWKGYPTSDISWEPEKNLNADELIAEFKWSFRPKKTKAKKMFIRAGWTTHTNSSPSHLFHHTLLLPKQMLSESAITLHIPSASPVWVTSLLPSSAPSTSPSPELEGRANYKYISTKHCGTCRLPLQYDHILWSQGLLTGHSCKCGRTSSEPSPTDNTPEEAPTPQLACCTLPMHEDNNCHEPRYWSTMDQYKATLSQGKQAQDTSLWFPYRLRAGRTMGNSRGHSLVQSPECGNEFNQAWESCTTTGWSGDQITEEKWYNFQEN